MNSFAKPLENVNMEHLCLEISVPEELFGRLYTIVNKAEVSIKKTGAGNLPKNKTIVVEVGNMESADVVKLLTIVSHSRMGSPYFRMYSSSPHNNWHLNKSK